MGKTAPLHRSGGLRLRVGDHGPARGWCGVGGDYGVSPGSTRRYSPCSATSRNWRRAPGRAARGLGFRSRACARTAAGVQRRADPSAARGRTRAASPDRRRPALDRPGQCRRAEFRREKARLAVGRRSWPPAGPVRKATSTGPGCRTMKSSPWTTRRPLSWWQRRFLTSIPASRAGCSARRRAIRSNDSFDPSPLSLRVAGSRLQDRARQPVLIPQMPKALPGWGHQGDFPARFYGF